MPPKWENVVVEGSPPSKGACIEENSPSSSTAMLGGSPKLQSSPLQVEMPMVSKPSHVDAKPPMSSELSHHESTSKKVKDSPLLPTVSMKTIVPKPGSILLDEEEIQWYSATLQVYVLSTFMFST
ncbi:hypothetical protein PISMIDRAFT_15446 [Pisolithus microcarpus 441]|uniref:Uncharacterized protein n=1 Tax=Pisolithus microcarpus 441 TaxID=765257 RepID=A0A0C9Z3M4_9AGAM|nr:hypothetical protein PISMIDRAFT_15446 [Pisolithus microcarpus 441]